MKLKKKKEKEERKEKKTGRKCGWRNVEKEKERERASYNSFRANIR